MYFVLFLYGKEFNRDKNSSYGLLFEMTDPSYLNMFDITQCMTTHPFPLDSNTCLPLGLDLSVISIL